MVKISNQLAQSNTINASEMKPSRFYIVENPGSSFHGVGDLIFTNHDSLAKTYQVLMPVKHVQYSSDYKNLHVQNIRVREVDVEINIIGYSE